MLTYFYQKQPKKRRVISKRPKIWLYKLINQLCRLKTKKQDLNLGRLQYSIQPIQKLARFFVIYLQERPQRYLVKFLIFHFVLILISHLDARLCQILLICQGKQLSKIFPHIGRGETSLRFFVCLFLRMGTISAFLQSWGFVYKIFSMWILSYYGHELCRRLNLLLSF